MPTFVSLHNHTDYSLLRASSRVGDLVARAAELGMPALAITDDGNLFGALQFYQACRKAAIQPIIGCDFYLASGSRHSKTQADSGLRASRVVLLATSDHGYRNLIKLTSAAYTEGFYYRPRIDDELLERHHEDLICLTGSVSGDVPKLILMNQQEEAEARARWYRDLFGRDNFFFELNDHGIPEQAVLNRTLVDMSAKLDVPLVAANESYYVYGDDANAHDTLLCIGSSKKKNDSSRFRFSTNEFYLKSGEEIAARFADHPEAIENSVKIAERCSFEMQLPGPMFPHYEIPQEFDDPDAYLRHLSNEGLRERYGTVTEEMQKRLDYELDVIISMGFTGYFLIVWDFIAYARNRDIPVGPGRGSGAGSIVAYSLGITDIDPLKYNLLFERFLNPDRVSMPDFDIDFCYERRGEVIDYVTRKYGEEKVGQIITFGTLKARAVIRDVARALDLPFAEADTIAKLIPKDLKITIPKAIDQVPELQEMMEREGIHRELLETSMKLEGLHRHASTHAAGIVIGREELTSYVPLYRDPRTGQISTQYTMDLLEDCGLVKMDFLGLKTLTLIENTKKLIAKRGMEIDLDTIPDDDRATFAMLGRGESAAVFQFESQGMAAILKRARPGRIEDLIALNALYRPGPMENIDQFVDSKNGKMMIEYPLPQLERPLEETYGVIVYQEQVMEIVQIVAGFSLGQADILRRAMGKKKVEEMAKMRISYMEGARERGISDTDAERIFTLLEPFAGYGFNKSHAAAYSVLAYKTAYLKANYPAEFMAANLTNEINNPDTFADYMAETTRMGIELLPPDINLSEKYFSVTDGKIVYGLVGIKNVGSAAVDAILAEREAGGRYESFMDFCERIDTRSVNRKVIEMFVQCGLFDAVPMGSAAPPAGGPTGAGDGPSAARAILMGNLDRALDFAATRREARESGQGSLFEDTDEIAFAFEPVESWTDLERLNRERDFLGFYFSGHPLDSYRRAWLTRTTLDLSRADGASSERVHRVVGLLKGVRAIYTKKGTMMAFGQLEDFNGTIELVLFSDAYEASRELLVDETVVGVEGSVDTSRDRIQFVVETLVPPEELPERDTGQLHLRIAHDHASEEELYELRAFLHDRPGGCSVYLHMNGSDGSDECVIRASSQLMVSSQPVAVAEIERHPFVEAVWKQLGDEWTSSE
ncbi:MAG: DNA polymerase III subunit alpha [Spirochaetota bacterium]